MLARQEDDLRFYNALCRSDEATCHTCSQVNRHNNCRIDMGQNPHEVIETERDSPNLTFRVKSRSRKWAYHERFVEICQLRKTNLFKSILNIYSEFIITIYNKRAIINTKFTNILWTPCVMPLSSPHSRDTLTAE